MQRNLVNSIVGVYSIMLKGRTMNRQTGYKPNVYECHQTNKQGNICGTILSEEQVGVSPVNAQGDKELYCTACNSRNISLMR